MSVLAEQLGGDWNAEGMSESSPTLFVHYLQISQAACKGSKTCGMRRKQDSCLAPATPATPATPAPAKKCNQLVLIFPDADDAPRGS
jgi:hypothetical protein